MTTYKKNDIIINPKTNRPIRVGNRTWLNLVKEGLIEGKYADPNELYETKDLPNEQIETKIKEINKNLPITQQAVRGRGKYKDKIVRRKKQPTTHQMAKLATKSAIKVVSNNLENLTEIDDLEEQLERLIMSEILQPNRAQIKVVEDQYETKEEGNELDEYEEYEFDE